MKYVALLSGGKDSCYNLLHCSKNGHELVAAASLGPEHGKEELDSYLYQTVGQDAIEFVARALEVPLYRRVISGGALDQGAEYGDRDPRQTMGTQGDETEDLYDLLLTVKTHHPDVQGVSVGAILSNYQRVRVEHVCRRLSLTALSYLWQRDQGELMSEMIEAGMQSIIIKVAGIGLTSKHLGMTLSDIHPTLIKLNDLYGSHICGEGGEYETLTLDCPLFKHRVVLKEVETVIHSDNDFATVAFLRIKDAVLERKPAVPHFDIAVPPLLDSAYTDIENSVLHSQKDDADLVVSLSNDASPSILGPSLPTSSKKSGAWVAIANVQRDLQENDVEPLLEDEVSECFHKLEAYLAVHSLSLAHCTHINIFISSMDLFARVNTVYGTFFGTSPPSRACVCVDLSSSIRVRLDCVAFAEDKPSDRQALHVQGLSYWAPANIGPYSQSITVSGSHIPSGWQC
ncbi:hypothetical protein PLICRDRAFT_98987 [Plicaturopsis crispa FD-325 SS-3]|nr:hypothetical protein PLICRDRAFT_98987 [Plicaturopsis crispa FD-325 SS-3]